MALSAMLGHGSLADSGGHASGPAEHADADYGVDGHGHGEASAGGQVSPTFHFPLFSPLALAALVGTLGAYGLIARVGLRMSDAASLAVAIPAAVVTSYLVTYLAWRLVSGSRGSSQIRVSDLRGCQAEVITPIPQGGVGEVAALVNGQRFGGPAREERGRAVPRGATVIVRGLVGTTLVVSWPAGPESGAAS